MLVLPIKKKWFEMIEKGQKKEEYREIKDYYDTRIGKELCGFPFKWCRKELIENRMANETIEVIFRNGYGYDVPTLYCKCKVKMGYGKEEWGAIPGKQYYILEILSVERWNKYD